MNCIHVVTCMSEMTEGMGKSNEFDSLRLAEWYLKKNIGVLKVTIKKEQHQRKKFLVDYVDSVIMAQWPRLDYMKKWGEDAAICTGEFLFWMHWSTRVDWRHNPFWLGLPSWISERQIRFTHRKYWRLLFKLNFTSMMSPMSWHCGKSLEWSVLRYCSAVQYLAATSLFLTIASSSVPVKNGLESLKNHVVSTNSTKSTKVQSLCKYKSNCSPPSWLYAHTISNRNGWRDDEILTFNHWLFCPLETLSHY